MNLRGPSEMMAEGRCFVEREFVVERERDGQH